MIRSAVDGDGCCPADATSSDSDCVGNCGDGRVDTGEQCDGTPDCTDACVLSTTDACNVAAVPLGVSPRCAQCACAKCADSLLACARADATAGNTACVSLAACQLRTNCNTRNAACYCANLRLCPEPNGECIEEAKLAAGTDSSADISACAIDRDCTIGRAVTFDECRLRLCATECAMSD